MASYLGGGDVDGSVYYLIILFRDIVNIVSRRDLFSIIFHESLMPIQAEDPAKYESLGTLELDRESTVEDICDFIVEYINSDVLVCWFPSSSFTLNNLWA